MGRVGKPGYGGVPKGRLPSQPAGKSMKEAQAIAIEATGLVQFRIPGINPGPDPTYAWTGPLRAAVVGDRRRRVCGSGPFDPVGRRLPTTDRTVACGIWRARCLMEEDWRMEFDERRC
jgi:hypothetical protein